MFAARNAFVNFFDKIPSVSSFCCRLHDLFIVSDMVVFAPGNSTVNNQKESKNVKHTQT